MIVKNYLEKIPWFQGIFFACSITVSDIGINHDMSLRAFFANQSSIVHRRLLRRGERPPRNDMEINMR